MFNVRYSGKKMVALLLIGVVLAPSLFAIKPQKVSAQFGGGGTFTVIEVGRNLFANTLTSVAVNEERFKETVLDPIAWALVNALIQELTASIIDWVNSGFQGEPAFVTDLGGFLRNVADEEIGRFIEGSELDFLCDPLSAKVSLELSIYEPFRDRVTCTLTDVVNNINEFIGGDFSQGGWGGWFELTTKRHNNPYGAYLIASNELARRVYGAQDRRTTLLEFGDGFLSFEHCSERPANPSDAGATPGQTVEDCEITTPGGVIEERVNHALGSGQRRLEVADEIDEIISAVLAQLIQQTLQGGLSSLSGNESGSGSSYTSRLRGNSSTLNQGDRRVPNNFNKTLNNDLEIERDYRTAKQASLSSVLQTESVLKELKTCYECRRGITSGPQCPAGRAEPGASGNPSDVQNTIDSKITPVKTRLQEDIAESQDNTTALSDIQSQVNAAQNNNQLAEASEEYRALDTIHDQFAVLSAQDEQDSITSSMQNLRQETQEKLDACKANAADVGGGGNR